MKEKIVIKKNVYECSCFFKTIGICKPLIEFEKGVETTKSDFLSFVDYKASKRMKKKIKRNLDDYIEDPLVYERQEKLKKLEDGNNSN
jgi:hypothetical protein